jgi:chorismate mutase
LLDVKSFYSDVKSFYSIESEQGMTVCRGVRGATTVEADDRDLILCATRQMLALMIRRNGIEATDVASVMFTVTKDLTAEFPALAARQLGWLEVPLLCAYELSVPHSLPLCIRMMLHWNTDKKQSEIQHIYLHEAKKLRPDLNVLPPVDFEELEQWINDHLSAESGRNQTGT